MKLAIMVMNRGWEVDEYLLRKETSLLFLSMPGSVTLIVHHNDSIRDFSAARNKLMDDARSAGCDWGMFYNTDEAFFPHDFHNLVSEIATLPEQTDIVWIPRITFIKDYDHVFDPVRWPDLQAIAFRLDCRVFHARHERPTNFK